MTPYLVKILATVRFISEIFDYKKYATLNFIILASRVLVRVYQSSEILLRCCVPGIYEIGVHIADVSFFVTPGTELDEIASRRTTSVYLVQKV